MRFHGTREGGLGGRLDARPRDDVRGHVGHLRVAPRGGERETRRRRRVLTVALGLHARARSRVVVVAVERRPERLLERERRERGFVLVGPVEPIDALRTRTHDRDERLRELVCGHGARERVGDVEARRRLGGRRGAELFVEDEEVAHGARPLVRGRLGGERLLRSKRPDQARGVVGVVARSEGVGQVDRARGLVGLVPMRAHSDGRVLVGRELVLDRVRPRLFADPLAAAFRQRLPQRRDVDRLRRLFVGRHEVEHTRRSAAASSPRDLTNGPACLPSTLTLT